VSQRQRVVMVATSYPRFPGDTVGTFMQPIAEGLAARGHEIHMVLPWHPRWTRPRQEHGVTFHHFRYAPSPSLNVFGYAESLQADVAFKAAAFAAAPLAAVAAWDLTRRVVRETSATLVHGHWVVPGGAIAAAARRGLPLVVSLHGSDVYVAERHALISSAAHATFRRAAMVTACSEDLRLRAEHLGSDAERSVTIPYGVDSSRFRPDREARAAMRARWGVPEDAEVVFTAGRFVKKKGFEYLIDAVASLRQRRPALRLVLAGGGDLDAELRERLQRQDATGLAILPGVLSQDDVARGLAAADVAVVPSVRDDAGNVDGLPNVVMESMASGTPLIATPAGGIGSVVTDGATGLLVPERDVMGLAGAIDRLIADRALAGRLGDTARRWAVAEGSWARVAERFEAVYDRAASLAGVKSAE
jgi:glycosyltransferase involved in cell wall biosynthesis